MAGWAGFPHMIVVVPCASIITLEIQAIQPESFRQFRSLSGWERSSSHCGRIDAFALYRIHLRSRRLSVNTLSRCTRPTSLELESKPHSKWLGLKVRRHEQLASNHTVMEFVARYKVDGRAHRLHEISRFLRGPGSGSMWMAIFCDSG
ncbi:MAG TPA: YchJ family metal-binding protein, partial [Nitrosospira sp.]|nr:YchJ family metal-binding protein [Nitrosospira sp.]